MTINEKLWILQENGLRIRERKWASLHWCDRELAKNDLVGTR